MVNKCKRCGRPLDTDDELCWQCQLEVWETDELEIMEEAVDEEDWPQ